MLSYVTTERDLYRTFSPLLKEAIPPFALAYAETPALAGVLAIADEDGQIEFVDTTKGNQRVESCTPLYHLPCRCVLMCA